MLLGRVRLAGCHEGPSEDIHQSMECRKMYNVVTCQLPTYVRDVRDISYGFKVGNFVAIHRTYVTVMPCFLHCREEANRRVQ